LAESSCRRWSLQKELVDFPTFQECLCGHPEGLKNADIFAMSEPFAEHQCYSLGPQMTPKTRQRILKAGMDFLRITGQNFDLVAPGKYVLQAVGAGHRQASMRVMVRQTDLTDGYRQRFRTPVLIRLAKQ